MSMLRHLHNLLPQQTLSGKGFQCLNLHSHPIGDQNLDNLTPVPGYVSINS